MLEGRDFDSINELIDSLQKKMEELQNNKDLEAWERLSAAIGLAIYDSNLDDDMDSVFKRADKAMYENKKAMKAVRQG